MGRCSCGGTLACRQDVPYVHPCDSCGKRWLCDSDGQPIKESPGEDSIGPFDPLHSASFPPYGPHR